MHCKWTAYVHKENIFCTNFVRTSGQLYTNIGPTLHELQANFTRTSGQLYTNIGPTLHELQANFAQTLGQLCTNFGRKLGQTS